MSKQESTEVTERPGRTNEADRTGPGDDDGEGLSASRRRGIALGAAAVGGVVAATVASRRTAEAGHDGTNVLHLGANNTWPEANAPQPTQLRANVNVDALGPPGANHPGAALLVQNGDGSANKGWALYAFGQAGTAGGIRGETSGVGPGVLGQSKDGAGILGTTSSLSNDAIVGQWTGPANSPTPHSGVSGSTTGNAAGPTGRARQSVSWAIAR